MVPPRFRSLLHLEKPNPAAQTDRTVLASVDFPVWIEFWKKTQNPHQEFRKQKSLKPLYFHFMVDFFDSCRKIPCVHCMKSG